jgi:DNA-binding response OmpR family regulator
MNSKRTVLLVDDDPALLVLIGEILKDDYAVSSVKSGREALEMLANGYIPDIILLDVDMPGLNGFETLALMREKEDMRDVPVIYLTGVTKTESEVKGLNAGAADYITKPFVKESILARLKQHLENGKRLRQLSILEKNKRAHDIDEEKFERVAASLTATERKILRLIAMGYSNQEICDTLHYALNYVKKVASIIYEKNNVGNRWEMKKLLH